MWTKAEAACTRLRGKVLEHDITDLLQYIEVNLSWYVWSVL